MGVISKYNKKVDFLKGGIFVGLLESTVITIKDLLWDYVLIFLLCGAGLWFTILLKGVQIKQFARGWNMVFGNFDLNGSKAGKDGMSSFQAVATAIAAQVGTGNLAGAATAIVSGGPGAIFWMWVSAFLGMSTIFVEASMAQKYRVVGDDGEVTGGPVYYIRAAFKGNFGKILAGFFSVCIILALGFMGNMVQSNSIGVAFQTAFGVSPVIIGVVVAVIAGFIFIGGVQRIASITEKIVPIMAGLYLLGGAVLLIMNITKLPAAIVMIFKSAFNPQAVGGAFAGVMVKEAMKFGVARGLFSNEAGMGSTPHAHALAKVKHPCDQGCVAVVSVFIDTFMVLTMTALVIITSGLYVDRSITGVQLTQAAFVQTFGKFGSIFIAVIMFFFAFSTIIGWYFFGERNVKYLFGPKVTKIYAAIVVVLIVVGSALKVELVWNASDMFNGLMVIPNIIGLFGLTKIVSTLYTEYQDGTPVKTK